MGAVRSDAERELVIGIEKENGKTLHGISLTDIQVAKELLGRVGVSELKTLLDLLAK